MGMSNYVESIKLFIYTLSYTFLQNLMKSPKSI